MIRKKIYYKDFSKNFDYKSSNFNDKVYDTSIITEAIYVNN